MLTEQFRDWMIDNDLASSRVSDTISQCRRIEKSYGDLDAAWDRDRLTAIMLELQYSVDDERNNRKNSSRIHIDGNLRDGFASIKYAANSYRKFRETTGQ